MPMLEKGIFRNIVAIAIRFPPMSVSRSDEREIRKWLGSDRWKKMYGRTLESP